MRNLDGNDQTARWKEIARISDRLRNAEMVVTRRLHTALPCIGFGTPVSVYLEGTTKNRRRFSGHDRFVPMVFHDGEKPIGDTVYDPPRLVEIPDEMNERFLQLAKSLGASVEPKWNSISEFVDSLPSLDRQPASFW